MKLKHFAILLTGLLIFTGCDKTDEAPQVGQQAKRYWEAIFTGRINTAYQMLDRASKASLTYSEFGQKIEALGAKSAPEIDEYYKAYAPLTFVEIGNVYIKNKTARVEVHLTHPDPTWFPSEANAEAQEAGLAGQELAMYLIKAKTQAIIDGDVPIVDFTATVKLLKEDDIWRIVFDDYSR